MTARRVLVTGATGFVGANLVRHLLDRGDEVHATGRPGGDRWRLAEVARSIRFHDADLGSPDATAAVVDHVRPDWIFHLAAYGAYPWQDDLAAAVRTNVLGTAHLAEACLRHGFAAFVHSGSSSEYGLTDHAPAESEALDPNSHYAVTKAAATLLCRHLSLARNAPLVTLRLYSAYGPFEEPTRLIPALVLEGLRGRLPPLAGADTARDLIHVDDVVAALIGAAERAADNHGGVFNLGTGVQTTLREIVELTRRRLGVEVEPAWDSMPARRWDTTVWVSDSRRIRERLGWRPRRALAAGLGDTIEWFRRHPELCDLYERRRAEAMMGRRSP